MSQEAEVGPPGEPGKPAEETDSLLDCVNRITSMCPNCEENGETRILLHRVPHFKDLLISSFSCPHCNYANREVQAAGSLAPRGVHIECRVASPLDLNRQVVRSEHCEVQIPEVELEVPASRARAELNTVEGLVASFAENLKFAALYQMQLGETEKAQRLSRLVRSLKDMAAGQQPFLLVLHDPSGNSYVEGLALAAAKGEEARHKLEDAAAAAAAAAGSSSAPQEAARASPESPRQLQRADSRLLVKHFERTKEQLHAMGYFEAQEAPEQSQTNEGAPEAEEAAAAAAEEAALKEEALLLPVDCPHCGCSTTNKVCQVNIPGFRECLIFAFCCPNCGAKNSEIKAAGAYGLAARRWILTVEGHDDLNRDVLKGDTATVEIPSLDFSMEGGAEAGTLTTVEGLLKALADGLSEGVPFASGDSAAESSKKRMEFVCEELRKMQEGVFSVLPFKLIINDPADLSFVALREAAAAAKAPPVQVDASTHVDGDAARALAAAAAAAAKAPGAAISEEELQKKLKEAQPGEVLWSSKLDETLTVEVYKRTPQQDDSLGLLDMKT
ncbi:zinc-finger protein ZPR1, putative [Eimeria tenella]|uniref:Zinc-finger protein ZPR1, putative n=1 Tax=Eimeria tenella TaxID=5802 RepID=U6KGX4_EIMTE|nr:zinc-finger protein ZPR1, putative [Eimeria tenella]CDJ37204.1 zinc-finger protein ZPR1, putative [Eimeria tenella]|eukprot:XP_013228042.1 zinc-finger protein ZPR1, putative [Eimeria tenella]